MISLGCKFLYFHHEHSEGKYKMVTFVPGRLLYRSGLYRGGKSGQRRALCFLTGRSLKGDDSVTENDHPDLMYS